MTPSTCSACTGLALPTGVRINSSKAPVPPLASIGAAGPSPPPKSSRKPDPVPNVLQFSPRKPSALVATTAVLEGSALQAEIEAVAQAALDQADRLIAILDRMDGNTDDEDGADGADGKPSLGAPEGHSSQIVWLRGGDRDLEVTNVPEPTP